MLALSLPAASTFSGGSPSKKATLSNEDLPRDQHNQPIITGEASALAHSGKYYFYFNDWGTCPGVDCCDSAGGCADCCFDHPPPPMEQCSDPYGPNHTVRAYQTADLVEWTDLGVALTLDARHPGIEFRPCVVFNAATGLFVLWYEDRYDGSHGYNVAVSESAGGPFRTTHTGIDLPGSGRVGDFNIFVDDDGSAYHVRTGFDIVRLDADFTGPEAHVAAFSTPKPSEGPTMFKRAGRYYVTAGTGCCACLGGASIYVLSAVSPAGPWAYQGDVGSVPGRPFDAHSPLNYVTKAQGSAVLRVGEQTLWLGNQWNSGLALSPPGPRNHDLLYWAKLEFGDDGAVRQLTRESNVTVQLP